jgi:hypothetical protein
MDYLGSLDAVSSRSVRGWAFSPGQPCLDVDIFAGGDKIGSVEAKEFRQDLKDAGIGEGNHAFYFVIPEEKQGLSITCRVNDFVLPVPSVETGDEYFRWRVRRRKRLLAPVVLGRDKGLEFGALHDPLIDPTVGNIRYVDHASTGELKKKYAGHGTVDPREIVPVDYAVALHVGEHTPDFIGWLIQVRSILKRGGTLSVALPDKRYCFDFERSLTQTSDLVGAYLQGLKRPSATMIFDSQSNAVRRNGALAWYTWQEAPQDAKFERVYSMKASFAAAKEAFETNAYVDAHCWVFTAESFLEQARALTELDLFPFRMSDFHGPDGHEFIAILEAI